MEQITLNPQPFPKDQLQQELEAHGIQTNRYAEIFLAHPAVTTEYADELAIVIASLQEIGLKDGASLPEIFRHIENTDLCPCPANTGIFLRLAWQDQPQSRNSVLSGTHRSPDQAVMALSNILEDDPAFPKGLYLRNVDGSLWIRGYVCDPDYRFSANDLFAFQKAID